MKIFKKYFKKCVDKYKGHAIMKLQTNKRFTEYMNEGNSSNTKER